MPSLVEEGGGPPGWPRSSTLRYDCVSAMYHPGLAPVLRSLSFSIQGGTSCGVVGRTGSGKSSLVRWAGEAPGGHLWGPYGAPAEHMWKRSFCAPTYLWRIWGGLLLDLCDRVRVVPLPLSLSVRCTTDAEASLPPNLKPQALAVQARQMLTDACPLRH